MKNIYSRKHPGHEEIGTCIVCNKRIIRSDGFVVLEREVIYKDFIHHSPINKCFEEYMKLEKEKLLDQEPNPLDEFWKSL